MVHKADIERNLRDFDTLYNDNRASELYPLYYSKLALLELCGWIETTMDEIVMNCAKNHLKNRQNVKFVQDEVINRTRGFHYEDNFRGMLVRVMGLVNVERLEGTLDPTKFHLLKSTLGTLKTSRDTEAHTYVTEATKRIDAPSKTRVYFTKVYEGLEEIERCVKTLRI